MEINLNFKDIKKLILENYSGITDVISENDDIIITLKVDIETFSFKTKKKHSIPPPPEKSLEEKNKGAIKKGTMATGGKERTMMRF